MQAKARHEEKAQQTRTNLRTSETLHKGSEALNIVDIHHVVQKKERRLAI